MSSTARASILDAAFSETDLANEARQGWIGRRWVDTVTVESRQKVDELLRDATQRSSTRWRQVNHPAGQGADIPIRYRAIRFGPERRILAVGRDLRPLAAVQQRLAETQQEMEREYTRIRNAEKRYRLLFQLASEAVLILDSNTARVLEANPAAVGLLGVESKKLVGHAFEELFAEASRQAARSFLAATRVAPRVDNVHVQLGRDQSGVLLTGTLYRQDGASHLVVLLSRLGDGAAAMSNDDANMLRLVEAIPEAFVVADAERRVLTANAAFLDLVQATTLASGAGRAYRSMDRTPGRRDRRAFLEPSRPRQRSPFLDDRTWRIRRDGGC